MAETRRECSPCPQSENMFHGPFPSPNLDQEPTSAHWIMQEAHNDPELYQLMMLKEKLREQRVAAQHRGETTEQTEAGYQHNLERLKQAINAVHIRRLRAEHPFLQRSSSRKR